VDVVAWAVKAPAAVSSHVDAADLADPSEADEEVPLRRHERDGNHQRNTSTAFSFLLPYFSNSISLSLSTIPND
jgi:hypothetical protein